MGTDEYKKLQKARNAIEGIPSVFRRKLNVDRIPSRGLRATRMFFHFKVFSIQRGQACEIQLTGSTDSLRPKSG